MGVVARRTVSTPERSPSSSSPSGIIMSMSGSPRAPVRGYAA
jgi:hypothetical protein